MIESEKAVLLSIQPKWCELIASGKKTIEVRKTKPKLPTPFKCYIHQTKRTWFYNIYSQIADWQGKVIGEFMCDEIIPISVYYNNPNCHIALKEFPYVCMTDREIMNYLGNGKKGYTATIAICVYLNCAVYTETGEDNISVTPLLSDYRGINYSALTSFVLDENALDISETFHFLDSETVYSMQHLR